MQAPFLPTKLQADCDEAATGSRYDIVDPSSGSDTVFAVGTEAILASWG
jgi:hypothetical protein